MITLKEAIELYSIPDNGIIRFCTYKDFFTWSCPMLLKEIKEKVDLENTIVAKVIPHRLFGVDQGFEFHVDSPPNNIFFY